MFFTQFLESANKNYWNGMSKIVSIIKNILCLIERNLCGYVQDLLPVFWETD